MNSSSFFRSASSSAKSLNLKYLLPKTPSAPFSSSSASALNRKVFASSRPSIASSSSLRLPTTLHTRTMASTKPNADTLLELIKGRRTYYALSKDLTVSKDRIQDIVKEALREVPSSFNSQSNRVVVLFGAEHDKFWGLVTETLRAIVPAANWASTETRMSGFAGAAGTVLFFEDQTVVEGMQAKFAIYADRFPGWAAQSDAMLQFTIWTALEAEGLGANLQHYNPIVDDKVAEAFKVPATWKLNAQLVFGARAGEAGPKEYLPLEERYKVFGA